MATRLEAAKFKVVTRTAALDLQEQEHALAVVERELREMKAMEVCPACWMPVDGRQPAHAEDCPLAWWEQSAPEAQE